MLSYRALEVLHSIYRPVLGRRVKDYIASPKPNGYQSIHSSAQVGEVSAEVRPGHARRAHRPRSSPVRPSQVQVRTSEMHYFAEHGKASHWLYKAEEGRPVDQWQRIARIASDKAAADKGADQASRAARGSDAAAVTAVFGTAPPQQRSASSANSAIDSPIADDDLIETAREAVAADSEDSADPPRNSPRIERQTDRPGKRRGGSRDLGSGLAKSGSRSPLLEWLRQSIRETQVYAVVNVDDASTVLTLPVDATLRDAMVAAAADKLVDVDEGVVMNARVNGRAVRAHLPTTLSHPKYLTTALIAMDRSAPSTRSVTATCSLRSPGRPSRWRATRRPSRSPSRRLPAVVMAMPPSALSLSLHLSLHRPGVV